MINIKFILAAKLAKQEAEQNYIQKKFYSLILLNKDNLKTIKFISQIKL